MTRKIKTAEEHIADIGSLQRQRRREQTEYERERAKREAIYDIRDDVLSLLQNSGKSDEYIHENFGPHPTTLKKWRENKYVQPRMGKMQSTLYAIGKRFAIVDL
jgi:hypothetical protein